MSHRGEKRNALRDWLRRGDPAADGAEPDPQELARMRRRALDAERGPVGPGWPVLRWAGATALVSSVLLVGWHLVREVPPTGPRIPLGPETTPPASTPTETVTPATLETPGVGTGGIDLPRTAPAPEPMPVDPGAPAVPAIAHEPVAPAPGDDAVVRARQSRQVQFTTPYGTRVIWTLNPNLELEPSKDDRAAQGETS